MILGRKGFIFLAYVSKSLFITEGSQKELKPGRGLESGVDAEAWRKAAYCFAPHGLLGLLSCRRKDH